MGSAGNFTFGGSAAVFDIGLVIDYGAALNASGFFIQSWGGGDVEIQNAGAGTGTYRLDINGTGHLTINANCSATTSVDIHGNIQLTNNATGVTIEQSTNLHSSGSDIATDVAALQDISAADVNAQVLDVLNVAVFAELTGVPAASVTAHPSSRVGR